MLRTALHVIIIFGIVSNILVMTLNLKKSINKMKKLSGACNGFTTSLYKNLSEHTDTNIIMSPFNLHTILHALSNSSDDSTMNELRSVLGYDNMDNFDFEYHALLYWLTHKKRNLTLNIINAVMVPKGYYLDERSIETWMFWYKTLLTEFDFKFTKFSPDTKILLQNGMFFKSEWQKPFDEKDTKLRIFHISKTESYLVPTMFKKGQHLYGEIPAWHTKFIEIPYLNDQFVMIILLPDLEIELKDLENNFNWETLVTQVHECKFAYNFNLYLPKFKINITRDVKDVLLKMGLNATFNDNANFTRLGRVPPATPESLFSKAIIRELKAHQDAVMRAARAFDDNVNFTPSLAKIHLKVNSVIHESCIEVQEHTEAKDKPVAEMTSERITISPRNFVIDRPFMFAVLHKPTNLSLILGSVRELKSQQYKCYAGLKSPIVNKFNDEL